jgi:hypothetical protein
VSDPTWYLTRQQLQKAVGDPTGVHTPEHDRAIFGASRLIDKWTGRYFWQETAPVARLFNPDSVTTCCVGDYSDPDSVTVATDVDGDGVFETVWDRTDWQAEPFVLYNGDPYTLITTTTRTRQFPIDGRRPNVQVTTRWGWTFVPGPIVEACEVLSVQMFRAKDMGGVDIGMDVNTENISGDPIKLAMLCCTPYAVEGGTLWKPDPNAPMPAAPGRGCW